MDTMQDAGLKDTAGEGDLSEAAKIKSIRAPDQTGQPSSQFWGMFERSGHGVCLFRLNCGRDKVNAASQVMASATELHQAGGVTGDPVMAPASMEVWNVTPHNSGLVEVRMNIQWHAPIPVRINLVILN
jgi:hypothetical protein